MSELEVSSKNDFKSHTHNYQSSNNNFVPLIHHLLKLLLPQRKLVFYFASMLLDKREEYTLHCFFHILLFFFFFIDLFNYLKLFYPESGILDETYCVKSSMGFTSNWLGFQPHL